MYFELVNPNPISVCQPEQETLDNPGKRSFSQLSRVSELKLSASVIQLLINSNILLPPAAIRVELIIFSGPKWSFGQRDSADCKQRGTKWSAEVAESHRSLPQGNPTAAFDIIDNPKETLFRIIEVFLSW